MKQPLFNKNITINEYLALIIRIALLMVFYSLFRVLFYIFNKDMFSNISMDSILLIFYGGFRFDISAISYLNMIYVLFYFIPLKTNFKFGKAYQRFLKIWFVAVNGVGFAFNSIDIIYYRFILKRTTYNVKDILANEDNLVKLSFQFIIDFWYIFLLFILMVVLLSFTYSIVKPKPIKFRKHWQYSITSIIVLLLFISFMVAGGRGGFKHSTRPISLSNAGRYVKTPDQMAIVLNTPFCILRTWNKKSYIHRNYFNTEDELNKIFNPVVKGDTTNSMRKKNVVIIILESFNREYIGTLNPTLDNGNYKGYTPFLDSLINESWSFTQAYANGRKSIDAMPSVIASIPSLVLPYVISEYSSNHVNSLASLLNKKGYESAFFHGAPNGSMGLQSFANLVGFDKYMGKTEYNNNDDYDGIWGIWDHNFFDFFANEMDKMKEPFFTTLFSISSHHPFKLPDDFEGKYKEGYLPIHKCVSYTDDALRTFFNKVKNMAWYKNTVFVITADHSTFSYFKESKTNLGAYAIPLLFYAPADSTLKKIDNRLVQQTDIMPTILDYLNYDDDYIAFGNNLLKNENRGVMNYVEGYYQFIKDDLVIYFNGEKVTGIFNFKKDRYLQLDIKDSMNYEKYELEIKAIIQQYNNRMLEDRLLAE